MTCNSPSSTAQEKPPTNMDHDGDKIYAEEHAKPLNNPDLASLKAEKRQLEARLQEAKEVLMCRVCLDQPVAAVFMPCAHLNSCRVCSTSLTSCPLCRSPIHYAAPVIID